MITDPTTILPEYFAAFSMYVCDASQACLERSWIVPPVEDQLEVVRLLREYQRQFPLHGNDGLVFALLNNKNDETLEQLLHALLELDHAQHVLEAIRASLQ